MNWTGVDTAVHSAVVAEPGPPSVMRPEQGLPPVPVTTARRRSPLLSAAPKTPATPLSPVTPASPTPRQVLVVAALVSLTSLATAVVMAQGVRHLDVGPTPGTTPYLADAPHGPIRAPLVGTTAGSHRSSVTGQAPDRPGSAVPDRDAGPGPDALDRLLTGGNPAGTVAGRLLRDDGTSGGDVSTVSGGATGTTVNRTGGQRKAAVRTSTLSAPTTTSVDDRSAPVTTSVAAGGPATVDETEPTPELRRTREARHGSRGS